MLRRTIYWRLLFVGLLSAVSFPGSIAAQSKSPAKKTATKAAPLNTSQGLSISSVSLSAPSFNPSRGDKIELRYNLSRQAKITIQVFDADQQLARSLVTGGDRKAGRNKELWDGKDMDGKVVPNEAYLFCIEAEDAAKRKTVFDPVTFSGGEFADITQGQASRQTGTVSYKLSQPSRVLLRAGLAGSGLLKTIVDWEPRQAGEITEYWNGKDEDGVIDVWSLKNYRMVLSYMTLPEASVITIGNNQYDYRTYKARLISARTQKEKRPLINSRQVSPHFWKSRSSDRAFKVRLVFPEFDKTNSNIVPSVKDKILVRVEVPEQDRAVLANQQFEIILFVDTVFHAEEERGYLPFNFPLELKNLPAGEHVIMVNIISFSDQIGVGSRKIRVTN